MTPEDDLGEPPLDPMSESLRRKMVRLLAMGIGTMMLGLMAVLGAVVYKTTRPVAPTVREAPVGVALPADAAILGSDLDGDRIALRLRSGGHEWLFLVTISDGAVLARYDLGPRP